MLQLSESGYRSANFVEPLSTLGDQARNRSVMAGNDDLFPFRYPVEQFAETSFSFECTHLSHVLAPEFD